MTRDAPNELLSDACGEDLPKDLPHLRDMLDNALLAYPDNIAVASRHQPSDLYAFAYDDRGVNKTPYLRWTQRMLRQAAERLAASLQYRGYGKGTTIATVVPNGVEWVLLVYASVLLGATIMPMSPRTLVNATEATHMLKTAGAKVLVASDAQIASSIDRILENSSLALELTIRVDTDESHSCWIPFSSLLESNDLEGKRLHYEAPTVDDDGVCIIAFTSGTTSLPKGCPLRNRAIQQTIYAVKRTLRINNTSSVCAVMPNNHLMAFFHMFSYPSVGGKIVFPAPSFEPQSVRAAFEEEQCTNLICVPTMLYALLDTTSGGSTKLKNVRQIDIGGAAVSPRHMRQCIHDLGAKLVGTSFGMTEGTPLRTPGAPNPEDLIRGDSVLCGGPLPGTRVRICDPETRRTVERGQYGELHQSGNHLIDHYMGLGRTKEFYTDDDGINWFRSGDQAVMHTDGNICIVGRYKDMIIRGGENISPATIERVLNESKDIDEIQVVGCKDDIAGEVPVAVYRAKGTISVKALQDSVLKRLGPVYVPGEFFQLHDLGLDEFPKTVSGKIQKTKLTAILQEYMQKRQPAAVNGDHGSIKDQVLRIWSSLLAIPADSFDLQTSVDDFADSITIMRFRDKVKKETGKNISLEEMVANSTIASQIHLLESKPVNGIERSHTFTPVRSGPPTALDIVHVAGGDASMAETKALVEEAICPEGFNWDDDVEDVIPAYDYITVQFTQQRATSHNRRHASVTTSHDTQTLKAALRAALSNHSTLRSFFVRQNAGTSNELGLYVTMRPNDRWFDQAIIERGSIKSVADLKHFASEDKILDHSFPGPLFRAYIFHVEETGTAGYAWNGNHVMFDAMGIRLFNDDLEKALDSPRATLDQHIPFKFWADTYYSLRGSLAAQEAVKWNIERLAQMAAHKKALFPPQRAPRWFLGPARGWRPTESDAKSGYSNLNRDCLSKPTSYESNGVLWHGELPSVRQLRAEIPRLSGPPIAKAALALMNVYYTKHSHALFCSVESARSSLPFVPDHLAPHLDHINCADVSGPCFEFVVDLIEVKPEEPLSKFLARMQEDQNNATRYANAPVCNIIKALGTNAEGTGAGDMMIDVFRRQLFNWAPGVGNAGKSMYENFQPVLGNSQSDNGIVFNAGMGGQDGTSFTLQVRWDDANVLREEAEGMIQTMAKILTWITEGGAWDRPVGKFVECL